ncbi:MAG TPA: hypothetical protein VJ302_23150 [Blastocatellia bacterium]|nr:hypothetical protein [Blastocatellia bacterium]
MANNTTSETFNAIILKLAAIKRGNSWQAKCPAHDDKNPSLSISQGDDGRILLYCHTGCSPQSIVTALGLEMSDLFAEKKTKPVYEIESVYDYRDESNRLLFQAVRRRLT